MGGASRNAGKSQPKLPIRGLHRAPQARSRSHAAALRGRPGLPPADRHGRRDPSQARPHGLLQILEQNPGSKVFYIGDTVDDARCARASKVPFIGISAPANPRYLDLVFLFQAEGPYAIVDDINYLTEVFA